MRHKERQVDKETAGKLEDFHKFVDADAEEVIFRIFPSKVILHLRGPVVDMDLSESFKSLSTSTDVIVHPPPNGPNSNGEPDKKKRKREAGEANDRVMSDTQHARYPNVFHANEHLVSVHETLKKECEQLVELTDKVKLWINLTMPKIEDGDNFGVQIQEEVLNELHRSQESGYTMRDSVRQHLLNRAKICSKIIKYPHLEDYALALQEHDDKQLYIARQNLSDLRNVYAIMTDILHKNIIKLRSPKGNNGVGLY
ncbi:proteasome activator pa28 REG alpha/beta subunit [Russula earlei]|uniref:Proteasome activator pa28 REG alpha/beta subunit n=1 Tax=Russula earlei TaxID=71964 RepID=A0ACC0UEQ2_9AGAM|nr:proteasome activator pa28 REG alpha/beta subunit [Russula earlei]